jgi:hypothetical protein
MTTCEEDCTPRLHNSAPVSSALVFQDDEAHRQNYQQQIQDLTAKLKRTEEVLRSSTTDFILCRRDKQEAEARATAAEQMLQDSQHAAAAKVQSSCESICALSKVHAAVAAELWLAFVVGMPSGIEQVQPQVGLHLIWSKLVVGQETCTSITCTMFTHGEVWLELYRLQQQSKP